MVIQKFILVLEVAYSLQLPVVYETESTTSCLYVEDNTHLLLWKQG